MRLPFSKAYRAFKELDRFSDTQCVTFTRAARPRGWRRAVHAVVIFGVSIVGLAAVLAAYAAIWDRFFRETWYGGPAFYFAVLPTLALAIGVGPVLGFVVKDILLRRGIRRVLLSRGSCSACKYTITGLAVDDAAGVKCPECGAITTADPTLGEILNDEKGGRIFLPSPEAIEAEWPVFFTQARVRRWSKRVGLTMVVLFVVLGVFAVWWEWSVRRQVAAAKVERNSNSFVAYSLSLQEDGSEADSVNGFEVLSKVGVEIERKINGVDARFPGIRSRAFDAKTLLEPDPQDDPKVTIEQRRRGVLDAMNILRLARVFDPMKQVTRTRRAVHDPLFVIGQPLPVVDFLVPQISEISKINTSRMAIASAQGELEEFATAAEEQLAVARLCAAGSTDGVVQAGEVVQRLTYAMLIREIVTRRDAKWIDAIDALVSRQQRPENPSARLDVQRLARCHAVSLFFSDSVNFYFGRWTQRVATPRMGLEFPSTRPGSFDENMRTIDLWHATMKKAVSAPNANWSVLLKRPHKASSLTAINIAGGLTPGDLQLTGDVILYREALRAVIAIERHRLETGAPPERLEDLVPSRLESLPRDPWSGGVLRYRLEEKGRDPEGCGYVLYSVGRDGVDDGGDATKAARHWWLYVYGVLDDAVLDVVLSP